MRIRGGRASDPCDVNTSHPRKTAVFCIEMQANQGVLPHDSLSARSLGFILNQTTTVGF